MGDSKLDELIAHFKVLSSEGQEKLLAEARRLAKRESTAAIFRHVAKQKRGNRANDVEMGFEDFAGFARDLPVDQRYVAQIWKALAIKAGRAKEVGSSGDWQSRLRKLRFTVGLIRQTANEVRKYGITHIGNQVGEEVFELLDGWEKTL